MEKRVNKKIDTYLVEFKESICKKIMAMDFENKSKANELIEYIYEYEKFSLQKDDLNKRKRVKNLIPVDNRCNAKRANGEQCTRRRKDNCEFCGTHSKGTPNGLVQCNNDDEIIKKVELVAKEFCGLVYYIDDSNNVYNTEDVISEKQNPRVVAKYVITENDRYTIPELGLF